jgi:spore coat protein U-like protein
LFIVLFNVVREIGEVIVPQKKTGAACVENGGLQMSKIQGRLARAFVVVTACLLSAVAIAASTTMTFTGQVTIAATCTINSASSLNFGTQGVLAANVDQTSTIQVTCTNTTPFTIGLDAGTGPGATVAARKLTSGGSTVNYTLYADAGHTTVWGNTVSSDAVAATGNGSAQSFTVYGRVPPQAAPAPGNYSDTITVTVTY